MTMYGMKCTRALSPRVVWTRDQVLHKQFTLRTEVLQVRSLACSTTSHGNPPPVRRTLQACLCPLS